MWEKLLFWRKKKKVENEEHEEHVVTTSSKVLTVQTVEPIQATVEHFNLNNPVAFKSSEITKEKKVDILPPKEVETQKKVERRELTLEEARKVFKKQQKEYTDEIHKLIERLEKINKQK